MGNRGLPTLPRLFAALGVVLAFLGPAEALGSQAKRVLVVHSFGSAAPPFTTHSLAFESELTSKMGERIDLDEVYLDVARYATLDMEEALVEFMLKRREKWDPDLVVPIGSPSGVFVAKYRARLFPLTTPVIYTGMDQRRLPPGALQHNAAFVGESFDLPGLVEDILQLAPATTNIAVIIGASPLEHYWKEIIQQEYARFTNRVNFSWFDNLSFEQMLERSATLPPRSFLLLILLMRDANGVAHNADEALMRIRQVANTPINGIFQHQLGLGIVGGRLYQAELEGIESAHIAVHILRGEPATNFPPRIVAPSAPRYDWRELQRWRISEAALPPGSEVRFRERTFWERNSWRIVLMISAFIGQASIIFLLLANLAKRRHVERSLIESESRLRAILDTAVEGIITVNQDGIIESVNEAAAKLFGYSAVELIGRNVGMLIPSPFDKDYIQYLAKDRRPEPNTNGVAREATGVRKDGSSFPIDLAVSEIVLADRRIFTGFVRDITERRQVEAAAREFGARLLRAQESERARLARELHDDITQRLARLAIDAGRLERGKVGREPCETLRDVREGLVRLSEDVHTLSYRLHPSMLEDLGLAAALRAECERFARQESLKTIVKLEELPKHIPAEVALCLFRIAQEALRNVARHAHAAEARVSLRSQEDGLQLSVQDDGRGFNPRLKRDRVSLGLASMRERIRLAGGELDIESTPGQGTTIIAWIPIGNGKTSEEHENFLVHAEKI